MRYIQAAGPNNRLRTIISAFMLPVLLALPLKARAAADLEDASRWIGIEGLFDIIENTMILQGDPGAAFHLNELDRNDLLKFKARFTFNNPEHSWVVFNFRSDNPGGQIWENENTYFFLIRKDSIAAGRRTGGGPIEFLVQKDSGSIKTGRYHEIEAGVRNRGSNQVPRLTLVVDGKKIIEHDDFDASDRLKNSAGFFSVNVFRDAKVELVAEPGSGYCMGSRVYREIPLSGYSRLDSYDQKWGIIQHVETGPAQYYHTDFERNNKTIRLNGLGSLVYKDIVRFSILSFDIRVTERPGSTGDSVTVLLNKSNRDSYYGTHGYGLRIYPDGKLGITAYEDNVERKYPAIQTGLDFTVKQNIRIEMEKTGAGLTEFYIFTGDAGLAYKYEVADIMPDDNNARFIGLVNSSMFLTVELSDIAYLGEMEEYSSNVPVKPVYLQDFFTVDGQVMLHWVYRTDQPCYYKVMITDDNDLTVGEVLYPQNRFYLPPGGNYDRLYLTGVNLDGTPSGKAVVDLQDERAIYYAGTMERITIRPDNRKGAYFYSPGMGEFIINGVNYTVLRFGDHATFEPATGFMPACYDPFTADSLLKLLKKHGFNTVRVFIAGGRTPMNPGTGGDYETTTGLCSDYMENFVDFLTRAKKYGIYVMPNFCENELPNNKFLNSIGQIAHTQDILFAEKGLEAKLTYMNLFLNYIRDKDETLLTALLAVQAQNEFVYFTAQQPFLQTEGTYRFYGSGLTYDMADPDERRRLANDAMQHYFKALKKEIASIDPGLLLSVGTSTLRSAGIAHPEGAGIFPGDYSHTPMTAVEYLRTDLDFLDIHSYGLIDPKLSGGESNRRDIESMLLNTPECLELRKKKPVMMGEYGSFMHLQESFEEAKDYILNQRNAALEYGLKGVMVWSFDTFLLDGLYTVMEDGGDFLQRLAQLEPVNFSIPRHKEIRGSVYIFLAVFSAALIISVTAYVRARSATPALPPARPFDKWVGEPFEKTMPADLTTAPNPSGDPADTFESPAGLLKQKLAEMRSYPFTCNLFGEFEMHYRGQLIRDKIFSSIKAKELLGYLLIVGKGLTKDEIITVLWEDSRSKKPEAVFHATLYNLRNSLRRVNAGYDYINCKNRLYSVQEGLFFCTNDLFDRDLEEILSRDKPGDEEVSVIEEITGYYKGEFLSAYDYEWASKDREYYHALYEKSILKVCEYYIKTGNNLHAIKGLNALIEYNPYREEAYILLFTAYANLNDLLSLKRVYAKYKLVLAKELNASPSEEFTNLFNNLLIKSEKSPEL